MTQKTQRAPASDQASESSTTSVDEPRASNKYAPLVLSEAHERLLTSSCVDPEIAVTRGYKTVSRQEAIGAEKFHHKQVGDGGFLIPVWNAQGERQLCQLRRDDSDVRYQTPKKSCICVDVHPSIREHLDDLSRPLWITEGIRKADCAISIDLTCVGLLGVTCWKGKADKVGGPSRALDCWDYIPLKGDEGGRDVVIAFDSDVMTKPHVRNALDSLTRFLKGRGANVRYCLLPDGTEDEKMGLDDYIASGHDAEDLELLVVDTLPPAPNAEDKASAAQPWFMNYFVDQIDVDGEVKDVACAVHVNELVRRVHDQFADAPFVLGDGEGLLFLERRGIPFGDSNIIRALPKPEDLTALFQEAGGVRLKFGESPTGNMTAPRELAIALRENVIHRYNAVAALPHEPRRQGTYYASVCDRLPESDGSALQEFADALNPETEADRALLVAALATPGWGGLPGCRPGFIMTSRAGRGSGKTKTAEVIADVWGGSVDLGAFTPKNIETLRSRLLDNAALSRRTVIIDNLKGAVGSAEIESLITAKTISGKRMYFGEFQRVNDLTFFLTANTPELSADLADRCVVIRIGEQKHDVDFATWSAEFLAEHRAELVADILALLRGDSRCEIPEKHRDRFQSWQSAVLSKFENGNELAARIVERRKEVDSDREFAGELIGVIADVLRDAKIETGAGGIPHSFPIDEGGNVRLEAVRVFIPSALLLRGVREARDDKKLTPKKLGDDVNAALGSKGPLRNLTRNSTNAYGRGWVWTGDHAVDEPLVRLHNPKGES